MRNRAQRRRACWISSTRLPIRKSGRRSSRRISTRCISRRRGNRTTKTIEAAIGIGALQRIYGKCFNESDVHHSGAAGAGGVRVNDDSSAGVRAKFRGGRNSAGGQGEGAVRGRGHGGGERLGGRYGVHDGRERRGRAGHLNQ